MEIKHTTHATKSKHVVNTPASQYQRQPRVYASVERARDRIEEILRVHPDARVVEVRK